MKPFNLQEALAGKPTVTRNGKKILGLLLFKQPIDFPVVGLIEGTELSPQTFTTEGKWSGNTDPPCPSNLDLFMATEKKRVWVFLWKRSTSLWYGQEYFSEIMYYRPELWTVGFKTKTHSGATKELIDVFSTEIEI
jgi:hypothetical protein